MTKGSDLLVRALENEGVERIFGVPGEENLDVVESLRSSRIELVVTRHEQSAAFMAATYGRLTGKPGVCLTTLGPGALNLTTGAAYAHLGAMPMVMITGQKAIMSSRQARFQIVDMIAAMRPLTKMTRQIVSPASIPTIIRDAFRFAMEERPGPVHLELPEDVAGEETPDIGMVPPHPIEIPVANRGGTGPCRRNDPEGRTSADHAGGRREPAARDRRPRRVRPADRHSLLHDADGKRHGSGGSNLYMGTAALSERDYVHGAIDKADLIIAIGHDTVEKPPFIMGPNGPKVIHVSYTPANVEQVYFPHAEVVGDVGPSLELLADRIENRLPNAAALLPLRDEILNRITDRATEERFPPTPQRIVHDVRQVIPEDGIVALDNGMYKIWFARNYRTRVANTLLLDNALATMGAGLPSAMMAAMLHPKRRVLAVCGDGGFMMNTQEMETAVRLKLNLVVLILEDDAYGMIRWKQAVDDFADWGLTFGNPDFVKYAEAYGAQRLAGREHGRPGSDAGGCLHGGWRPSRHRPDRLFRKHPRARG